MRITLFFYFYLSRMKKPHLSALLFTGILLTVYLVIGLHNVLPLRPQSVHQWAQCDRASVALNFSTDTYNIFKPRIHNTANGTGISGMEFPLVNYFAGMLYRLFGFHEILYRILMTLIVSSGLIAAFKMSDGFLENKWYAGGAVLLLFLSPVLVYYTPTFIPDAAGLGFILCGWYFYFRYKQEPSKNLLILLLLFISMASLVKITNLISVMVMLLLELESTFRSAKTSRQSFLKKESRLLLSLFIPIALCFAWYSYASWLSETNNSDVFLLKQKSINSSIQFFDVINEIRNIWLKQYYSKYMYFFIVSSFLVILLFRKKVNAVLYRTTMWLWVGNIVYFSFMMAQFPEHDYYIIVALPVILFQSVAFFSIAIPFFNSSKILKTLAPGLLFALIIHGVLFSKRMLHDRYDLNSWMANDPVLYNYFDMTQYARSLGIQENDRVVSAFDNSPQITLYLMNQKGVTVSRDAELHSIIEIYSNQVDYLILNDTAAMQKSEIATLNAQFLGAKNNVYFYRLKKLK